MDPSTRPKPRAALRLDPARGWIGGVCAGIAEYLATDPVFVRAAVVLAGFVFPTVVIVGYAAAWILLND